MKPFRIWNTDGNGEHGGCVAPLYLQFETSDEAEAVAARYRVQYPKDLFTVIELDANGNRRMGVAK